MTPAQRAAALRLADKLNAVDVDVRDEFCVDEAAALLRELAAEPVQEPVAWMSVYPGLPLFVTHAAHEHPQSIVVRESYTIPLYAAPQPQATEPSQDTPPQGEPVQEPECQYAKDVGMPEYRCAGKCQYAAPQQQRKPLSDAFVSQVVRSVQPNLSATCKAWAEQFDECKYWLDAAHEIGEQK